LKIKYFALFIFKYNKNTLVNFYGSHPKSPQVSIAPPLPYTTLWPTICNRIPRRKIWYANHRWITVRTFITTQEDL